MSIQDTLERGEGQDYKREYPLFRTCRLRKDNILKIKKRATRYGQTFDEIVSEMLSELEAYENEKKRGTMT
jgi:hypothetical protein